MTCKKSKHSVEISEDIVSTKIINKAGIDALQNEKENQIPIVMNIPSTLPNQFNIVTSDSKLKGVSNIYKMII